MAPCLRDDKKEGNLPWAVTAPTLFPPPPASNPSSSQSMTCSTLDLSRVDRYFTSCISVENYKILKCLKSGFDSGTEVERRGHISVQNDTFSIGDGELWCIKIFLSWTVIECWANNARACSSVLVRSARILVQVTIYRKLRGLVEMANLTNPKPKIIIS